MQCNGPTWPTRGQREGNGARDRHRRAANISKIARGEWPMHCAAKGKARNRSKQLLPLFACSIDKCGAVGISPSPHIEKAIGHDQLSGAGSQLPPHCHERGSGRQRQAVPCAECLRRKK